MELSDPVPMEEWMTFGHNGNLKALLIIIHEFLWSRSESIWLLEESLSFSSVHCDPPLKSMIVSGLRNDNLSTTSDCSDIRPGSKIW